MTTIWPITTISNISTTTTTTTTTNNYADAARIASLHAKYISITISGIISNVVLVLLIFLSRTLRTTPFFWNILNLCVFDSVIVMFVIPFGLDYELDWSWSYGEWTCKMWYAADFWHMLMAGTTISCICIDRIVATFETFISIKANVLRFVSIFLVTCPWLFLVTVCIPLLVVFENNESKLPSSTCFFQFHAMHMKTMAIVSLALPNSLMIVACTTMLFVYILKGGNWNRIPSNRASAEEVGLKLSVIAVWVVVTASLICWLPVTGLVFFTIFFDSKCKGFTWSDYMDVYLLQIMTSSLTPFLWIILPEVRHELAIWRYFISGFLRLRKNIPSSLAPSYQNETQDSETEIQDNTI